MFGEDEQELVAEFYCLINRIPRLGADRQVMRRKPASHPFVLQIRMKPLREILVLARIADEATVPLDGLIQEGRQVFDQ